MRTIMHKYCLVGLFGLISLPAGADGKLRELTLGSVAMDIPAVMHQRLSPLAAYLSTELKRPVRVRPAPSLSKAADDIAHGSVDIAYLTPVAYVRAHKAGKVRILAKTVTRDKDQFRLMLVARTASSIRSVRDLAGKRFAFGDPAALLQRAVVVNAGVRLEELGSSTYLGHYDNIARGVANGDFDAGILKDTTAAQWKDKGLRVFYSSPLLPPYNIVVNNRLDDKLVRAIQNALIKLHPADPSHQKVIQSMDTSYTGFAVAEDSDYDVVRRLIEPFQN